MGTSIFIASFIFGLFLLGIIFLLQYYVLGFDIVTGLLLGLGGVALFILFQYLVGPAIVGATSCVHYLKPGENPWLESNVKELAEKSGVPMPKIATVPNNTPNAFVFGRSASSATLAVHDGLLRSLNQDEIRGVIAHELGHVKHSAFSTSANRIFNCTVRISGGCSELLFEGKEQGGKRGRSLTSRRRRFFRSL